MENGWNGGGEGEARCNMEMISVRDAVVLDCSVHGGDSETWTGLRNLQNAKAIDCNRGVYMYMYVYAKKRGGG